MISNPCNLSLAKKKKETSLANKEKKKIYITYKKVKQIWQNFINV